MSEYQYYEFQALDQRLSEAAMAEMRDLSSRAVVTGTSASFVYNYGDFRGDPKAVLAKHFDAMLYMANWGTRRLTFRLPQALVDVTALRPYCVLDTISLETHGSYVILDIDISKEESEWIPTGEGRLTGMIPLRAAILAGDYRAPYLAWLRACELALGTGGRGAEDGEDWTDGDAESGEEDWADGAEAGGENWADGADYLTADWPEPPVPPNLRQLDGSLQAFVDFFEIDPVWVEVGAEASPSTRASGAEPLEQWIAALPVEECRRLLLRAARGEPNIALVIRKELQARFAAPVAEAAETGVRRTAGQLAAFVRERKQRAAAEQRRRDEAARVRRLEALAQRETAAWDAVIAAIEERTSKGYDEAVSQLRELRELAEYRGDLAAFQRRFAAIAERFRRLTSLRSRFVAAGLLSQ